MRARAQSSPVISYSVATASLSLSLSLSLQNRYSLALSYGTLQFGLRENSSRLKRRRRRRCEHEVCDLDKGLPSFMETHSNFPTIMDSLAVQCKKKLETFRVKELKQVLSRIGAAKQGKKQVLLEKIMAIILSPDRRLLNPMGLKLENLPARHTMSREDVAKVIDDIYRMSQLGALDLVAVVGNAPVAFNSQVQSSKQDEIPNDGDSKIRCFCGNAMDSGSMIQCKDPSCLVWRHVNCVITREDDMQPEIPTQFFCEICRIQRGDPFCVSVAHPLMPTKTIISVYAAEGGSSVRQNLEASFTLSRTDRELLCNRSYDLQIWCVLLGDEVTFRMHWPFKAELRVNDNFVCVTNRPDEQKLGANGRDDGPVITDHTREGLNRISFSAYDGRSFCIGVRIIHRLTVDQVFDRIPSEAQGESFDMALSRVRRCIGGGGGGGGDDSDSDLEVITECVTVNLCCPMSGSRMKMAARFKPCMHMGCFDLRTFVELNQRARKWQCPICLKNYSLHDLIIDPFFTRITRALKNYGEDVTEVEMKPDGCWRPKLEGDAKFKEPWRSPECLITSTNGENMSTNCLGVPNAVKVEEGVPFERVPLKIGFKRTQDGTWQVKGITGLVVRGHNHQAAKDGAGSQSSTAAASNEDSSINQDPNELLDQFKRDEIEVNSMSIEASVNTWPNGQLGGVLDQLKTSEIIVLSDTEEENANGYDLGSGMWDSFQTAPVATTQGNGREFASDSGREFVHGGSETLVPFSTVGSFQGNTSVPLDFFGTSTGSLDLPLDQEDFWPTEAPSGPSELFSSLFSMAPQRCHPPVRHTPFQAPKPSHMLSSQQLRENIMLETTCSVYNGGTPSCMGPYYGGQVIEDTRDLTSADSSLQFFLPHQPARSADKPTVQPLVSFSEGLQDGWFSLSLGSSESFSNAVAPLYGPSQERTRLDPLLNSASALLDLSKHGTRIDESPFTQRRTKGSTIDQPANNPRDYF